MGRVEVRRENQNLVERHFDFRAGDRRQVIVLFLERHDPAVEQIHRSHLLAAEVVDHEDAAVRLHLQRGFVVFADRVVCKVQHRQREFAADDDRGPLDLDVPPVEFVRLFQQPAVRVFLIFLANDGVQNRVEHADDLPVRFDGVRHVNRIAHQSRDPLGHARFAVAGVTEEEDRLRGVDRRADLVERFIADDEVFKGLANTPPRDDDFLYGLREHGFDVIGERYGQRADVARFLHRFLKSGGALRRLDFVDECVVAATATTLADDVDQRLFPQRLQHRPEYGEWHREFVGDLAARELAARENHSQDHVEQERTRQAEFFPFHRDSRSKLVAANRRRAFFVGRRRVAEERHAIEAAVALGIG